MTSASDTEFTSFAQAVSSRLLGTAYLLCGDWHTAEDLTQTALAKVYASWPRISSKDAAPADSHRGAELVPVRTATNTGLAPVHLPISHPSLISVSPDGSTVYVSGELLSNWLKYAVFPIPTGAKSAGRPVAVPGAPVALVFAP